jgi:hypothetical protein
MILRLCVLAGAWLLGSGAMPAATYEEPDFTKRIFNADAISLEGPAREEVVTALAGVVGHFSQGDGEDMDLVEKAMAIALRLDNMHPAARAANDALLEGRETEPVGEEIVSPAMAAKVLWQAASELDGRAVEPADAFLVPYLMDLAISLEPRGEGDDWEERLEKALLREGAALEWRRFVSLPPEPRQERPVKPVTDVATATPRVPDIVKPVPERRAPNEGPGTTNGTVLPNPRPEVTGEPGEARGPGPGKGKGNVVTFGLPEGSTNLVLYVSDRGALSDPKFWLMEPMKAAKLTGRVQVRDPGDEPDNALGQAFFRRIYSRVGIFGDAAQALGVVRNRFREKFGVIPQGSRVELKLTNVDEGEDLPLRVASVGAPAYVVMDAMAAGAELDPTFAIAGGVGPAGEFRGTVRAAQVLAAAMKTGAAAIVIPREEETLLRDAAITGDFSLLFGMQVFAIDSVDEAGRYMMINRAASVNDAMKLFNDIRALLGGVWTMEALARNPAVHKRLEKIVALCPDHISASILLAYGTGQLPAKCSVAGSLVAIEKIAAPPLAALEQASSGVVITSNETLGRDAIFAMRKLKPKLHSNSDNYADAVEKVLEIADVLLDTKNRDSTIARQKIAEMAKAGAELVVARQGLIESLNLANDE